MLEFKNVWNRPQVRLEVSRRRGVLDGDKQTVETLHQLENEPRVEVNLEPNDSTDYVVHNADGSVTRVSQVIDINGVPWYLVPGKNMVPKTVYEHLIQAPENRHLMSGPKPGQMNHIGLFSI